MILVESIVKSYGCNRVLRELSFSADAGEITLLVGANGAGKSTTMKVLAGLVRPNRGHVSIDRFDITEQRIRAQRALSYLPQRPNFHPRMTCGEILRFYTRLRGVAASRYEAVLELAGLREFERVRTSELSGGTRQRLGLALLLLPDAPVLLLDEPGLSLDPGWRKRLQKTLRFEAERGKTVLVTTHLIREWNNVAHRCLLCHEGRIERQLDPSDLPHNFEELDYRSCAGVPGSARLSPIPGSARASCASSGAPDGGTDRSAHPTEIVVVSQTPRPVCGEARALPSQL